MFIRISSSKIRGRSIVFNYKVLVLKNFTEIKNLTIKKKFLAGFNLFYLKQKLIDSFLRRAS